MRFNFLHRLNIVVPFPEVVRDNVVSNDVTITFKSYLAIRLSSRKCVQYVITT